MARAHTLLDEALDAWSYTRSGVIDELENLPAGRWDFRPAPPSRSIAEIAQHLIENGLLAVGELTRPDGDFTRQSYDAFIVEHAGVRAHTGDRDRLLSLLRETLDEARTAFAKAGLDAMLRPIRQFNGAPASRFSWLHHAIAHEEYHRGQLALCARLLGLTPALTRAIEEG